MNLQIKMTPDDFTPIQWAALYNDKILNSLGYQTGVYMYKDPTKITITFKNEDLLFLHSNKLDDLIDEIREL